MDILEADLKKRGKIGADETRDTIGRYKFAKTLLTVYNQYPLDTPNAWFSLNYCALGEQHPVIAWLLRPFCDDVTSEMQMPLNDVLPPPKPFCDPKKPTNC